MVHFSYANFQAQGKLLSKRRDIFFAMGIISILVVLVLPLPPFLLDLALGISLTLSVIVLMTVLFVEKPLHLSSFPTILLIVTMLRLSLNIASTRLILSHGHEGTAAAGHVIQAFGGFVMGGSVIIGAIIFGILSIINFIVITKGSGRIAEVSARFSLDAMPGKQMAIDADLSAGLITEDIAKARRKELARRRKAQFLRLEMDGASKFVRGDAIAGLLIVFINFIAGILIGVVQNGLTFSTALHTYTVLTVGDGLVSHPNSGARQLDRSRYPRHQIGCEAGSAEKAVLQQLGRNPDGAGHHQRLPGHRNGGALPGIPMPCRSLLLAGATGYATYYMFQHPDAAAARAAPAVSGKPNSSKDPMAKKEAMPEAKPAEEQPADFLQIDSLRLELGYGLLPLINYQKGHRLTEQIKALESEDGA